MTLIFWAWGIAVATRRNRQNRAQRILKVSMIWLVCRTLIQAICFPLLRTSLGSTRRTGVDLSHAPVGFWFLRPQLGCFLQVMQRTRVFPCFPVLLREL